MQLENKALLDKVKIMVQGEVVAKLSQFKNEASKIYTGKAETQEIRFLM
jgi:hypothetical protein